jgi:hypothetical protein
MLNPRADGPAGAGRVIAREHGAQHASRISREGIVFREPPDMAGGPVFSAQGASLSRNHSAGDKELFHEMVGMGTALA